MRYEDLLQEVERLPMVDIHSHLPPSPLSAKTVEAVMFYHMLLYPLRAAGVDEALLWPGKDGSFHECGKPVTDFFRAWPSIENTTFAFGLKTILRDLYGFDEPLTADRLDRLTRNFAAAQTPTWGEDILRRVNMVRVLSSQPDMNAFPQGIAPHGLRATYEATPIGGTRETVSWKQRLDLLATRLGVETLTPTRFEQAFADFYGQVDWTARRALVTWVSSYADLRPVSVGELERLFLAARSGKELSGAEHQILDGFLLRTISRSVAGKVPVHQVCFGMQFLTGGRPHAQARVSADFVSGLGSLIGELPNLHFDFLSACEAEDSVLCSLALAYSNVSLSGYWWHMFYPSTMRGVWHRRLDMLPVSRLCGFFSDGYCAEWIYARARITQRVLARVLWEKIDHGYYTPSQAIDVARKVLHDTPRQLFLSHRPD